MDANHAINRDYHLFIYFVCVCVCVLCMYIYIFIIYFLEEYDFHFLLSVP